jgi:hypothetical protein
MRWVRLFGLASSLIGAIFWILAFYIPVELISDHWMSVDFFCGIILLPTGLIALLVWFLWWLVCRVVDGLP